MAVDPGGNQAVFDLNSTVLQLAQQGVPFDSIVRNTGSSQQQIANILSSNGYAVSPVYPSIGGIQMQGSYVNPSSYTYSAAKAAPTRSVGVGGGSAGGGTTGSGTGGSGFSAAGNIIKNAVGSITKTKAAQASGNPDIYDPGWRLRPSSRWDANELALFNRENATNQANLFGGGGGISATAAADLAEKKREFDLTMQRDIAKENATEIDSLQKLMAGQTGPKDPYGYLFESRGMAPPQGYNPTSLPFTDAQEKSWLNANPGKTRQDLIDVFRGKGTPQWAQGGGNSLLGNMPNSMQAMSPSGLTSTQQSNTPPTAPVGAAPAAPGTQQLGATNPSALAGGTPTGLPGSQPTPQKPPSQPQQIPGAGVPSMAVGGEVPGGIGQPQLTVLHGGEEVNNNTPAGQLTPPNNSQVHPAIAKVLDALNEMLSNPDFASFTGGLQAGSPAPQPPSSGKKSKGSKTAPPAMPQGMPPGPQVTPGGMQAMAAGGMVMPQSPLGTDPLGGLKSGGIAGQAAGQVSNTGKPLPQDKPIIPMAQLDPYSKALYDRMGRLHPYSAQQETQMGPSGVQGVQNYLGKVAGIDVNDYVDLAKRLAPQAGAPQAGDVQSEGFVTG